MRTNADGTVDAACHCGTVRFTVKLIDGLNTARCCNCSLCRMRGAVAVSTGLDGIRFKAGEEALTLYQFNTGAAKHYFCSKCGIYTHHLRRSMPDQYGVNAACLADLSPFDFARVKVLDGARHSKDPGGRHGRIVGFVTFEPVDDD